MTEGGHMSIAAKQTRENRTITVDFRDEATYFQLLGDGKAFVEFVFAFLLALGFQLLHKATCDGGGCLTRHSHYARVRLGGVTIWRLQWLSGSNGEIMYVKPSSSLDTYVVTAIPTRMTCRCGSHYRLTSSSKRSATSCISSIESVPYMSIVVLYDSCPRKF